MPKEKDFLEFIKRIRALAQNGLVYAANEYDTERYTELLDISNRMTGLVAGIDFSVIANSLVVETDYVTPKTDIRAVIFNKEGDLLLVKERADNKWSLPGGWADIGYSPSETAIKEVLEETGLHVLPVRLLAVIDKRCHPYPPALHYAYKLFILCSFDKGTLQTAFDILDVGFFSQNNIPTLSEERVISEHIDLMFDFFHHPDRDVVFD